MSVLSSLFLSEAARLIYSLCPAYTLRWPLCTLSQHHPPPPCWPVSPAGLSPQATPNKLPPSNEVLQHLPCPTILTCVFSLMQLDIQVPDVGSTTHTHTLLPPSTLSFFLTILGHTKDHYNHNFCLSQRRLFTAKCRIPTKSSLGQKKFLRECLGSSN